MVNVKPVKLGNTERMSFGKIDEVIDMPNLIDIQKASYKWLLDEGLKEVFKDVSGITDYQDNLVLDFIDYTLDVDHPNYSVIECKVRDATYSAALRVTARLLNKSTGEIKESNVFMGDFPLMTASGSNKKVWTVRRTRATATLDNGSAAGNAPVRVRSEYLHFQCRICRKHRIAEIPA